MGSSASSTDGNVSIGSRNLHHLNAQILDADVTFRRQPFKTPLVISSGPISDLTEAVAEVKVRVGGKEGTGRGSIYLSDLWAWPDPRFAHEKREAVLKSLCETIADQLCDHCGGEAVHPLELGLRLHDRIGQLHQERFEPIPALARSMCLSPFDAAIHDAVGLALKCSAFDFYTDNAGRAPALIPSADHLFGQVGVIRSIGRMLQRPPLHDLKAWVLVGKNDDLERTIRPWVVDRGYRCLKLKIMGKDSSVDVARTVEVFRTASRWGAAEVQISVDSNEANPDASSVLEYLQLLRETDPRAFEALRYLEQPTGRDIHLHRHDWRQVTELKPVLLDEGLIDFGVLEEASAQGWSGLALKTCKGHSFALVTAAWGYGRGMLLSMQDLTNPGLSAIHSALFAAHVPSINGIELNSPQFSPEANRPWLPRLAELFEPTDGLHHLANICPPGLGSTL